MDQSTVQVDAELRELINQDPEEVWSIREQLEDAENVANEECWRLSRLQNKSGLSEENIPF